MGLVIGLFDGEALRAARKTRGWSQRDVVVALDDLEALLGTHHSLGVDASLICKWEGGKKRPEAFYGARLCLVFTSEPASLGLHHLTGRPAFLRELRALIERLEVPPGERMLHDVGHPTLEVEALALTRRRLLQGVALAAGGSLLAPSIPDRLDDDDVHTAAQWLAWELWQRRTDRLHESELPDEIIGGPAGVPGTRLMMLRSVDGFYSFAHRSLIDFFVARRIFQNIAAGDTRLFSTAQTTHETDQILREFVLNHQSAVPPLTSWMRTSANPVLRVNSAGVLAKMGSTDTTDAVVSVLRRDRGARHLYFTAVGARVLGLEWNEAAHLLADPNRLPDSVSADRAVEFAAKLGSEVHNPRDGAARWCSILLLHHLRPMISDRISSVLHEALDRESCPENLRSIATVLAGGSPVVA